MPTVGPEITPLLTPAEVAAMFHVDPKTVARWAVRGRLSSIRTPGGHRRFLRSEVEAAMRAGTDPLVEVARSPDSRGSDPHQR